MSASDGQARPVNAAEKRVGRPDDAPSAIVVDHLAKRFRLYHERNDSLKASVMRGRRARFEEFWAIDDVSFDVKEGETFGIIGENGSGKSTMLKCMARILRPDRGSITVAGKVSALLELGAGFHPELSGRENVFLNGSILGLSRRELAAKFDEIVEFAGLQKFIDQPVKNYSSGMYVRLGFSVAINVDPDVLLVDEVLAVGDEQFQRRCAEKFAEMQKAGKTIVIVSHAMGSVRQMCDRLAWMSHGKLQMVGPTRDVIEQYLGDVHVDALPTSVSDAPGARWGSGEGRITKVELISDGGKGRPVARARTGDSVAIRMHYEIRPGTVLEKPTLGFSIHRIDGVHVFGVNNRELGGTPATLSGTGWFDYVIPELTLLASTYEVHAALQDLWCTHTYDWWRQAFRFDVAPAMVHENEGVFTFLGHWEHPQSGIVTGRAAP